MLALFSISDSRRVQMAAGVEGRANMVFTEVTIGPLGGLRDVVRLVPELLCAHVAPLLEVLAGTLHSLLGDETIY